MRFLGLGLGGRVPDENTILDFHEALTNAGAIDVLFSRSTSTCARPAIWPWVVRLSTRPSRPLPNSATRKMKSPPLKRARSRKAGRISLPNWLRRIANIVRCSSYIGFRISLCIDRITARFTKVDVHFPDLKIVVRPIRKPAFRQPFD